MTSINRVVVFVLDAVRGRPAAAMKVRLMQRETDLWQHINTGETDGNGCIEDLMVSAKPLSAGCYRLVYEAAEYFEAHGTSTMYPQIVVDFSIANGEHRTVVPLLLSPYGYTTYRGD